MAARLSYKRNFDPDQLRELGVAFENCCAAIPEMKFPIFREAVASRLLSWAMLGNVEATQLYAKALESYRNHVLL